VPLLLVPARTQAARRDAAVGFKDKPWLEEEERHPQRNPRLRSIAIDVAAADSTVRPEKARSR
jgi:hypothetical protein